MNKFEAERDGNVIHFYEPLDTTAPQDAHPWCCYLHVVTFYKWPLQVGTDKSFQKYDEVETAWNLLGQRWTDEDWGFAACAPFVLHDGVIWELTGGHVAWHGDGWRMEWNARRVPDDDRRVMVMRAEGKEHDA